MRRPEFNDSWSDQVKRLYTHDIQEIWEPRQAPHVWLQYHNQLDRYLEIAARQSPLKILDLGCAQGTLALLLAESGHDVTAVDMRQEFLDYAMLRYEFGNVTFLQGNVLEFDGKCDFDLVYANQLIEHLVYPEVLLRVMYSTLRPGGRLVVTTPNHAYVKNRHPSFSELPDRKSLESRQFTADGDGHFFAYTRDELIELIISAGFCGAEAEFFETPFASGHMKFRYLHRFVPGPVLAQADKALLKLPWVRQKLSHQLLVTAEKPIVDSYVD